MARMPTKCRLCDARRRDGVDISWGALCPPCGEAEVREWERDLSDITHQRYWEKARAIREGIRKKQLMDIQATIAAYPNMF